MKLRCQCGRRFTPKRRTQRHCKAKCRRASYEASAKGEVRRERYNASTKRERVQAEYNASSKGAARRDRWQCSDAGRAWREEWTAPERVAERQQRRSEAREAAQRAREAELRERMHKLATEKGVSVEEATEQYLVTSWIGVYDAQYLRKWIVEAA
jgi:hypothetical protein